MLLVLLDSVWYIGQRWTGLDNLFVKLFSVSLDSTKISFCSIQDCSSGEIFAPLKKIGQACQILYTKVNQS